MHGPIVSRENREEECFIFLQVIKTFSKNVEGCRDGSAKNHRN